MAGGNVHFLPTPLACLRECDWTDSCSKLSTVEHRIVSGYPQFQIAHWKTHPLQKNVAISLVALPTRTDDFFKPTQRLSCKTGGAVG